MGGTYLDSSQENDDGTDSGLSRWDATGILRKSENLNEPV